jgi:hypothetical protein
LCIILTLFIFYAIEFIDIQNYLFYINNLLFEFGLIPLIFTLLLMPDTIQSSGSQELPKSRNVRSGVFGLLAGLALGVGVGYGVRGGEGSELNSEPTQAKLNKSNSDSQIPKGREKDDCRQMVLEGKVLTPDEMRETLKAIAEKERTQVAQAIVDRFCITNVQQADQIRKAIANTPSIMNKVDLFQIEPMGGKFGLVYSVAPKVLQTVLVMDREPGCNISDETIQKVKEEGEMLSKIQKRKKMLENKEFDKLAAEIVDVSQLRQETRRHGYVIEERMGEMFGFLENLPDLIRKSEDGIRCGIIRNYLDLLKRMNAIGYKDGDNSPAYIKLQSEFEEDEVIKRMMDGSVDFLIEYVEYGGGNAHRLSNYTSDPAALNHEAFMPWFLEEINCSEGSE